MEKQEMKEGAVQSHKTAEIELQNILGLEVAAKILPLSSTLKIKDFPCFLPHNLSSSPERGLEILEWLVKYKDLLKPLLPNFFNSNVVEWTSIIGTIAQFGTADMLCFIIVNKEKLELGNGFFQETTFRSTIAHNAVLGGAADKLRLLIENRAALGLDAGFFKLTDMHGQTIAHMVACRDYFGIIELLIEYSVLLELDAAFFHLPDKMGYTVIGHITTAMNTESIDKMLPFIRALSNIPDILTTPFFNKLSRVITDQVATHVVLMAELDVAIGGSGAALIPLISAFIYGGDVMLVVQRVWLHHYTYAMEQLGNVREKALIAVVKKAGSRFEAHMYDENVLGFVSPKAPVVPAAIYVPQDIRGPGATVPVVPAATYVPQDIRGPSATVPVVPAATYVPQDIRGPGVTVPVVQAATYVPQDIRGPGATVPVVPAATYVPQAIMGPGAMVLVVPAATYVPQAIMGPGAMVLVVPAATYVPQDIRGPGATVPVVPAATYVPQDIMGPGATVLVVPDATYVPQDIMGPGSKAVGLSYHELSTMLHRANMWITVVDAYVDFFNFTSYPTKENEYKYWIKSAHAVTYVTLGKPHLMWALIGTSAVYSVSNGDYTEALKTVFVAGMFTFVPPLLYAVFPAPAAFMLHSLYIVYSAAIVLKKASDVLPHAVSTAVEKVVHSTYTTKLYDFFMYEGAQPTFTEEEATGTAGDNAKLLDAEYN